MRLALLALVLASAPAAQTELGPVTPYSTPFIPLSAEAVGVSEAGAFGRTSDPLRMLDNPALLSDFADGISVSGEITPKWLGIDNISTRALAVAGGTRATVGGLPVSLGVGVAYGAFDPGSYVLTDDLGNALGRTSGVDQTLAGGFGGAIDGPLRVRAGASLRRYETIVEVTAEGEERSTALAADLGVDVTAPVGQWIMPTPDGGLQFVADLTAGYALRGLHLSSSESVPRFGVQGTTQVGRTPSAGIAALVGFDMGVGSPLELRGASLEFLTTAEDQGFDVGLWGLSAGNVLLGVGDEFDNALVRRGYRLTLAETLTLSAGTLRGASFVERQSRGVTLSVGGVLRLAGLLGAGDAVHQVGRAVDLRYSYAAYTFDDDGAPFGRSASHGLTLRVRP